MILDTDLILSSVRGLVVLMGMVLIRSILVAVISIAVAVLPATAEAIVSPSRAEVTMADQPDMPCCPCCNTEDDFKATACVLKCVAYAAAVVSMVTVARLYDADGITHPPPA
jgi:hypothetical protein